MPNRRQALTRPEEPQPRYGYGLMAPITTFEPQPPGSGLAGFGDLVPIAKDYAGRVVRGEVAQEGLEHYGNLLRRVEQRDPQALNELVGELGFGGIMAGPMARTANKAKLAQAEALDQAGDTAEDIYRQTGWFKGADGHWRFEIDDSGARWTDEGYQGLMGEKNLVRAREGLDHPALIDAYPEMMDRTGIMFTDGGLGGASGSYSDGLVTLDRVADFDVLLHELQHAIQSREGFAGGGNPQSALDTLGPSDLPTMARRLEHELALSKRGGRDWIRVSGRGKMSVADAERELATIKSIAGNDAYRRLAGETEARTVQARRGLNLEQRQERPPWLDYDVPPEQQIVRYGGGESKANAPARNPTQTPEFQNWFGGSKVVDESGQPVVVYHLGKTQPGGKAVETFYPGGQKGAEKSPLTGTQWEHKAVGAPALQSGPGIWFGPKDTLSVGTRDFNRPGGTHPGGTPQDMAVSEFAATYPSYLSLKNPLVITNHQQRAALKESVKPYPERKKGVEFRPDFPYRFDGKQRQQLISEGYDGIILDIPGEGKEYIAFYPEQIKSAIGNRGTFDPNDPNIMMSMPEPPPTSGLQIPGRNR